MFRKLCCANGDFAEVIFFKMMTVGMLSFRALIRFSRIIMIDLISNDQSGLFACMIIRNSQKRAKFTTSKKLKGFFLIYTFVNLVNPKKLPLKMRMGLARKKGVLESPRSWIAFATLTRDFSLLSLSSVVHSFPKVQYQCYSFVAVCGCAFFDRVVF